MGTYELLLAFLSQRHLRYSPSVGDQWVVFSKLLLAKVYLSTVKLQ
jgi:hypothetical protein